MKKLKGLEDLFNDTASFKTEMGAKGIEKIIDEAEETFKNLTAKLNDLEDTEYIDGEPDELLEIVALFGKTSKVKTINETDYLRRLKGAMFGRFAGCALGAPLEFATTEQMKMFSDILGTSFPPTYYWKDAPQAYMPRYGGAFTKDFTAGNIEFLSSDDDIIYTFASMLTMEEYGVNFTTEDVAKIWKKYIPAECTYTAERAVMDNLNKGLKLPEATLVDNPYVNWIGGYIRCDGYGYVNPLNPQKAAITAYKDAYLTHRKSGLYSSMYFAAVISLCFEDRPLIDIFSEALNVVPPKSNFYKVVTWALSKANEAKDYQSAVDLVKGRFATISQIHSENNACLTIFGALIGENDFTVGIGHTVAMGFDNDCTAATVGSILGAHLGIDNIDPKWYKDWNNKAKTYLNDIPWLDLEGVITRFNNIRKSMI